MNWLQKTVKLAGRELYYHGTSAVNLSTILSQGLNTDHETVFDENYGGNRDIDTYGGVYFTKNLMTAVSAGSNANRKFLGQSYGKSDHVIVVAQIERNTPSVLIDEDAMPNPGYAISTTFQGLSPNGYWYMSWADNGYDQIDDVTQNYVEGILTSFNAEGVDPRFVENIQPLARDIIVAFVGREIGKTMEEDQWSHYKHNFPNLAGYTESEWEQKYRSAMNVFSQKAHRLTGFGGNSFFRQNIRIQEPINFRGSNRIVAIFNAHDNESYFEKTGQPRGYYNDITVEYMSEDAQSAIDMFIEDWRQRIGQHFIVHSRDGQTFYDNFDEEIRDR